jgi:hypothetical protein
MKKHRSDDQLALLNALSTSLQNIPQYVEVPQNIEAK